MGNPAGPKQAVWLAHAHINTEMFLFMQACKFKQSLSFSHTVSVYCLLTKHTLTVHTHHGGGHAVHIFRVEVALPVVGLHDSSQATIQSHVSLSVRGEDQKVGCTGAPTDLILVPIKPRNSERKEDQTTRTLIYSSKALSDWLKFCF